jgi:glycosyltransferase involved in cell wall biosynthesis
MGRAPRRGLAEAVERLVDTAPAADVRACARGEDSGFDEPGAAWQVPLAPAAAPTDDRRRAAPGCRRPATGNVAGGVGVPVKVVHVLRKYDPREWGGTETALHQLARGLRELGVESVVLAPEPPPGPPAPSPLERDGFAVRRFRAFFPAIGIPPERRRQLTAVGGNLLSWDLLPRLVGERDVAIVHAHALGRLGALARAGARIQRVPFVLSIHGGALDLPAETRQALERSARGGLEWGRAVGAVLGARRLTDQADAIVTSNETEAALQRARHGADRVHVLPHGLRFAAYERDERARAVAALPQLRGRRVLACVGRIDPVKNQAWLVEQMVAVRQRHPAALLLLVGAATDAAYEAHVRERVRALGLADHVLLTGPVEPASPLLAGLFQIAEVAVLPSLSETFGLILVEAWAAGTVVLASRTSGALSLVRPGQTGELFGLDSPAGFHAALDALLADPAARERMARAGRERARAQFDALVVAGRMRELYDRLAAGRVRCAS